MKSKCHNFIKCTLQNSTHDNKFSLSSQPYLHLNLSLLHLIIIFLQQVNDEVILWWWGQWEIVDNKIQHISEGGSGKIHHNALIYSFSQHTLRICMPCSKIQTFHTFRGASWILSFHFLITTKNRLPSFYHDSIAASDNEKVASDL